MATKSAPKKAASKTTAPRKPPARQSSAVEVTPVAEWKKPNPPLDLPSGKAMKIRNVGFQAFVKAGVIPNTLMSIVQSAIDRGVEPELDIKALAGDQKKFGDLVAMVDEVVVFVAISPEVHAVPATDDLRNEELLYVDEIDDEDKMFIFGVCTGGTRDVEQFRSEQANSLAAVQRG